ncbi:MAG: type IV pilin [Archaeoglobaceae archaeon]
MMNGVSSVVGVVLMVALTVLISAIVITMVFSFFSNIGKSANFVAFSISRVTENDYTISLMGGEIEKIDKCKVYKNMIEIGIFDRNEIGKSIDFQANSGDYVRVVCKFIDESESVVFERSF